VRHIPPFCVLRALVSKSPVSLLLVERTCSKLGTQKRSECGSSVAVCAARHFSWLDLVIRAPLMDDIAATARRAGQQLAQTSPAARNSVLLAIKKALASNAADVIAANAKDMAAAAASGLESAVAKRLILDAGKIEGLIDGLQQLIELPDPIGVASMHRQLADGLIMIAQRHRCACLVFVDLRTAYVRINTNHHGAT